MIQSSLLQFATKVIRTMELNMFRNRIVSPHENSNKKLFFYLPLVEVLLTIIFINF